MAAIAASRGQASRAGQLLGAADALREETGSLVAPGSVEERVRERSLAAIRSDAGETAGAQALAEGRTMTLAEAVAVALTE